jgi:MFS family permease
MSRWRDPTGRAVLVLAFVLALDAADKGTVGAVAAPLEHDLGLANTQIGLLVAVVSLVGGAATFPAGMLVDRIRRTHLLAGSVVLWGLAMAASALSRSFAWLLLSRLGLGVVTGTAGPSVASLIGDYVAASQRGEVYGSLLGGELAGTGIGLVGAGLVAGVLSWRWSFALLVSPAFLLAWLVWRLPEPERVGSSAPCAVGNVPDPQTPAASPTPRPRHAATPTPEATTGRCTGPSSRRRSGLAPHPSSAGIRATYRSGLPSGTSSACGATCC